MLPSVSASRGARTGDAIGSVGSVTELRNNCATHRRIYNYVILEMSQAFFPSCLSQFY